MSVMRIKDAQGNWQEVAALHGLPGTSVSITSISQSTEDDGYSVVTFSDGKQLRVKNGSKGSAGEGGSGGILWVDCTPSEDGTSFTANKTFEDVSMAVAQNKQVIARAFGGIFVPLVMIEEGIALFSAVFSIGTDKVAMTLTMADDGMGTASYAPLGGLAVANITTEDGETYTTDRNAEELYAVVSAGMPVYASLLDTYIPAQYVSEGEAVFRTVYPDGTVTVTLDNTNVANVEIAPGGGGDGGEVIVDVARDGDVYTTSMQADAIYTAYAAGKRIVCRADLPKVTGMLLQPTYISDVLVVFTGAFTDALFASDGSMVVSVAIPNANTAQVTINTLDKLPNPEPLTINGTSYDGSEAVNIDIAGGGGGGGSWVNINALSSTTAPEINYTKEDNGTAYSLTAAMIEITVPAASETGFVQIQFWTPDGRATQVTYPTGINTITGKWRVYCFVGNGRLFAFGDPPAEKGSDNREGIRLPGYSYAFIIGESISKISIISKTSLPSGSMFKVWGVRA